MFGLLAVFAIVWLATIAYYTFKVSRLDNLISAWIAYADQLEAERDEIIAYAQISDAELLAIKNEYGNVITTMNITKGKTKAKRVTYTERKVSPDHQTFTDVKRTIHALELPLMPPVPDNYSFTMNTDGAIVAVKSEPVIATNGNGHKNGDKSKDKDNKNQPTAKTEAKSELFEHKDYPTVVSQLGGTVSEVESKSIHNQLTKGNAVKDIVSNIKKWRENNAKKIANNK